MSASIFLGIWGGDQLRRVKLDELDLDSHVDVLKPHLVKELGDKACDEFELVFCGFLLETGKALSSYGVTAGVTIHVIEKAKKEESVEDSKSQKFETSALREFVNRFVDFRMSLAFRQAMHVLENEAEIDKVIAAIPGLRNDPVAIAFISSTDTMRQLDDFEVARQVNDRKPLIIYAAQYIMDKFPPSGRSFTSSHPPTPSGHSYSLDGLSDDDEDMEGDGPSSASSSSASGGITAAQLAAALAGATPSRITPEMLQHALTPVTGNSRYAAQLRQMREFGLTDEARNLRALTVASGDLQAAIDLVFNGALDD